MLIKGILNPGLNHLLSRIRHTQHPRHRRPRLSVRAHDRDARTSLWWTASPRSWTSACHRPNFVYRARLHGRGVFLKHNTPETQARFRPALAACTLDFEPHTTFKKRGPTPSG
jgi:hypothetical protein